MCTRIRCTDPLVWLLFALAVAVLHHTALNSWWNWDDPAIVRHAMEYSPWEYFFYPQVWQYLSAANLTPWLSLSFDLDLWLFGLEPQPFYIHQLLAIWVCAGLIYSILRLHTGVGWSVGGALAFLASAPVVAVSEQLMVRHYVEGLICCLLAFYLYTRAVRSDSKSLAGFAALFYALAATAKEVFIPFVGLVLFHPAVHWRQNLRLGWPFLVVAAVYFPWRVYMLGGAMGGYSSVTTSVDQALQVPLNLLSQLVGPGAPLWAVVGVLLVGLIWTLAVGRREALFVIVVLVGVITPLVPVAGMTVDSRFGLVPTAVLCIGLPLLFRPLVGNRRPEAIALLVVLATVSVVWMYRQGVHVRQGLNETAAVQETYGRFLWEGPADAVLWVDKFGAGFHYVTALRQLRGQEAAPRIAVDEIQLQGVDPVHTPVHRFDSQCQCITRLSAELMEEMRAWRARLREKPLRLRMERMPGNRITWEFGPYREGQYHVINGIHFGKMPSQSSGAARVFLPPFALILRYDSPQGWSTYSDPVEIDFEQRAVWTWQRGQDHGGPSLER